MALSEHCVERYGVRAGRAAESRPRTLRRELHALIAKRGVAVERPPSWFFGGVGATLFYVTIDGRWLLPVQAARRVDGVLPAPRYVATTFISRDLSDDDLAVYTGEELSALIVLPRRVVEAWPEAPDADTPAAERLRAAIAATGRAHRDAPAWVRSSRPQPDRFFVSLDDGTMLVVTRARRDEGHRAPFRAVSLLHDRALRALTGEALLKAVTIEYPAIREYRELMAGVPEDARRHLEQRIAGEGTLASELPGWARETVSWHGPVLCLGANAVLLLRPVVSQKEAETRWRAVRCIAR